MRRYTYLSILLLTSVFFQSDLYAQCVSDAGSLPGDIISTCSYRLDFERAQNHILDDNDVLGLIAFKDKNDPLGSILQKRAYYNNAVVSVGTRVDTLFYIASIAGDSLPNRTVDLDDPCLSFSNILTIRAGFLDVEIPFNCRDDSIPFNLSGTPPFSGWLLAGPGIFDTIFINSNTDYTINLPPNISSVKYDITSVREGCNREWTEWIGLNLDCGTPIPDKLSCSNPSVILEPMAGGGTPPYRYDWSNGMVGSPITVTEPGFYSATVTDAGGCNVVCPRMTVEEESPPFNLIVNDFCESDSIPISFDGMAPFVGYIVPTTSTVQLDTIFYNTQNSNILLPPGVVSFYYNLNDLGCNITGTIMPTPMQFICIIATDVDTLSCIEEVATLTVSCSIISPDHTYEWEYPDGTTFSTFAIFAPEPGVYTVTVTDISGCKATDQITIERRNEKCGLIKGAALLDLEDDCTEDSTDTPLDCWIIEATNGLNTFYATTRSDGSYELPVFTGDYEVSIIAPNNLFDICTNEIPVSIDPNGVAEVDFLAIDLFKCALMEVQISSLRPRRCFDDELVLEYCNTGTIAAEDSYIALVLDSLIEIQSADFVYTLRGDTVIFETGSVRPFSCGLIKVIYKTDCDAVLGQTLCVEGIVYPHEPCPAPSPLWSEASIEINAECIDDSIHYSISNVGMGTMSEPREYTIMKDGVIIEVSNPFVLAPAEEVSGSVATNGATIRIEVDQEDHHPWVSRPSITFERCGDGPFTTGLINIFPHDDESVYTDIECQSIRGSYDPNDKQAEPEGYGNEHFIEPNTNLEYTIRFQNTGNDTAFTVEILDTLSQFLDVGSVNPGVSSHDYQFEIFDTGILRFTFNDILLVDSFTNEPGSNGFVKYSIDQKPDVPLGSVIRNAADIYFDFNAPIYTNQTFHTVGRDFIISKTQEIFVPGVTVNVYPNPFNDKATFEIKNVAEGQKTLRLLDISGKVIYSQTVNNEQLILERKNLKSGFYFYEISGKSGKIATGKLMIE